jgi:hypothetical protein
LALFRSVKSEAPFSPPAPSLVQAPGVFGNSTPANYSIYDNADISSGPSLGPFPSDPPPPPPPLTHIPSVPSTRPKFVFPRPPPRAENFNLSSVTGLNLTRAKGGSKRTRRKHKRGKKNKKSRRSRR